MIIDLKEENVRDVRDKKRKKLIRAYTERFASVLYNLGPLSIDINAKNVNVRQHEA